MPTTATATDRADDSKQTASKRIPAVRTRFYYPFPRISDDISQGFEDHGDIIQLKGFFARVFCLRKPEHIECVFKDPEVGISKCPRIFIRLKWMFPKSVVTQAGGKKWADGRRRMKEIFESDYMHRYAESITELVEQMLETRWKRYAASDEAFDIYQEFQLLLTRLAFRTLFSKDYSDERIAEICGNCKFLETQFPQRFPPVFPTRNDARYRKNMRDLRQIMSDLITERRQQPTTRPDLLNVLLDATDEETGKPFCNDWIIDHMIEMYNSVRLANPPLGLGLRLILQHPEVHQGLIEEAREICQDRPPQFDDLAKLKYLKMVVDEVFRFYPSALMLPRWCEHGMEIDGYRIPPKSIVAPMIYHTHRNPNVFKDPQVFDPERWNPDSEEKVHPYARLAFGMGKRTCLGVHFATMIIRLSMTSIFRQYQLLQDEASASYDATQVELSVHPSRPMPVRIKPLTEENPSDPTADDSEVTDNAGASPEEEIASARP